MSRLLTAICIALACCTLAQDPVRTLVSVDVRNGSAEQTVRELMADSAIAWAWSALPKGNVSVHLNNLPLTKALQALVAPSKLSVGWINDRIWIWSRHDLRDKERPLSLDAYEMDSRLAFHVMSQRGHTQCVLDPAVAGPLTARVRNMPPEVALKWIANVLKCRCLPIEGGGYRIDIREDDSAIPVEERRVTVDADHEPVRDVLRRLFRSMNANWTIDPSLRGDVTVHLSREPLGFTLRVILNQIRAKSEYDTGILRTTPK